MAKRKTNEEFIKELKENGIEYTPLDVYKNATTKIRFTCSNGHIWSSTPHNILSGRGCPHCSNVAQLSNNEFLERLEKVNNKIEPLEEYKTSKEKIYCRCKVCDNKWKVQPIKLLSGRGCPVCASKNRGNKRIEDNENNFIERLKKTKPHIHLLDEYQGADKVIHFKCDVCGNIIYTTPSKIIAAKIGCKVCANNSLKLTNEEFLSRLSNVNPNIIPIEEYISYNEKIKYYCNNCHNYHSATPANLLKGYGCPFCNFSKAENLCAKILEKYDINYERQYQFNDLVGVNGGNLRFDFAIIDKNLNLFGLIEYDGEFHFKKQYDNDGFENLKIHDNLKNNYCAKHNIPLLRIPYWDFENIEKLIYEFVFNINNIQKQSCC